jgi:ATP synthase protein I
LADKKEPDARNDGSKPPADETSLADLDQRIQSARKTAKWIRPEPEKETATSRPSDMGVALRLSSELVAGVLVGAGIGWGFDRLFGTSPIGLIIFLGLGTVAGVRNVLRATREFDKSLKSDAAKQDQSGQAPDDKR